MGRFTEPRVSIHNTMGYKYYQANLMIYGKKYQKTFKYNQEGYDKAWEWIDYMKKTLYFDYEDPDIDNKNHIIKF